MGLFSRKNKQETSLTREEYDDWLNYIDNGGRSKDWTKVHPEAGHPKHGKYTYSFEDPVYNKALDTYFNGMQSIKSEASKLHKEGITDGPRIDELIETCKQNIKDYDRAVEQWLRYNETVPVNVPAYTRLAIIYDRQGRYAEGADVCAQAIARNIPGFDNKLEKFKTKLNKVK